MRVEGAFGGTRYERRGSKRGTLGVLGGGYGYVWVVVAARGIHWEC